MHSAMQQNQLLNSYTHQLFDSLWWYYVKHYWWWCF